MAKDWQQYASKRLGRNVERTASGHLVMSADELEIVTSPPWYRKHPLIMGVVFSQVIILALNYFGA